MQHLKRRLSAIEEKVQRNAAEPLKVVIRTLTETGRDRIHGHGYTVEFVADLLDPCPALANTVCEIRSR